ncbi:MAG: hypothetical protein ABI867_00870 [Kofleriaceae bacterium]
MLLLTACVAEPELSSRDQALNFPKFAAVFGLESRATLLQTSDTPWTLAKTSAVDTAAHTVTWTIAATKGTTVGGHLVVDGYLDVINLGTGPATLGNIVVNLQARQGNHWVTLSSDVADATQGDGATSANVVGANTTEHQNVFSENAASGTLSFMDRRYNTMFSLVPEATIQPWTDLPLLFSAAYDTNVLLLAQNARVRFEVVITFGNHPLGGPNHTDENVDINGNGIVDADEHKVRSIIGLFEKSVPATQAANATLTLADAPADISTMGTVTFTNPVINLGATSGTVQVTYDAGVSGGSITNCVHGTGSGVTDPVGPFTFTAVAALNLTTCTTATISQPTCTPGTQGCGWHDGDEQSYSQNTWGASPGVSPPAALVRDHFDALYPAGMQIGGTNYILLTSATPVLDYLPQTGPAAALNAILIDPTSSSSGIYGGQVAGLRLNIDFADAGYTAGTAATRFGDLHLCGLTATPGLNDSTIRQLQAVVNPSLGGDPTPYSIADLSALLMQVNAAFEGGFASTWAQDHVYNGTCP